MISISQKDPTERRVGHQQNHLNKESLAAKTIPSPYRCLSSRNGRTNRKCSNRIERRSRTEVGGDGGGRENGTGYGGYRQRYGAADK